MSAGRETQLWHWLADARRVLREALHMTRLENSLSASMPDVEGCYGGNQFWIELKCEARPKRKDTKIRPKFRPGQVEWLEKRVRAGGQAFVLLQVGRGSASSRYLISGNMAAALKDGVTEDKLDEASAVHPDSRAAWVVVAAGLCVISGRTRVPKAATLAMAARSSGRLA